MTINQDDCKGDELVIGSNGFAFFIGGSDFAQAQLTKAFNDGKALKVKIMEIDYLEE